MIGWSENITNITIKHLKYPPSAIHVLSSQPPFLLFPIPPRYQVLIKRQHHHHQHHPRVMEYPPHPLPSHQKIVNWHALSAPHPHFIAAKRSIIPQKSSIYAAKAVLHQFALTPDRCIRIRRRMKRMILVTFFVDYKAWMLILLENAQVHIVQFGGSSQSTPAPYRYSYIFFKKCTYLEPMFRDFYNGQWTMRRGKVDLIGYWWSI